MIDFQIMPRNEIGSMSFESFHALGSLVNDKGQYTVRVLCYDGTKITPRVGLIVHSNSQDIPSEFSKGEKVSDALANIGKNIYDIKYICTTLRYEYDTTGLPYRKGRETIYIIPQD